MVVSDRFRPPSEIEARDYQQRAIKAWLDNAGQGVLNMATGTGKTITSLLVAAEIVNYLNGELAIIIAVPYQHLVEQWAENVRAFGGRPILAYQSRRNWQERLEREFLEFNVGVGDTITVITTHKTFASEPFQNSLNRLSRSRVLVIGDEVHHLGAPHLQQSLPSQIPLRLGLSATPERWYDSEGTEALFDYFGGVVYRYGLKKAIDNSALCEYYYVPQVVELTDEEADDYLALSNQIGRLVGRLGENGTDADLQGNDRLRHLLFRRARLIGVAENKLSRLCDLLEAERGISHALVYCGDGSVEGESGEAKRHVDATVELLREDVGLDARRFTAHESQTERKQLLDEFESGLVELLVAIRCLDEGVDVPATKTAYMLASSSNPRQFVQRRGRILRQHPGKEFAVIHDFIVSPPFSRYPQLLDDSQFNAERNLVQKELERVALFADAARNHPDADIKGVSSGSGSLRELRRAYNLLHI